MTPYHCAFDCDFYVTDTRAVLAELPKTSVHTIVTSPPYWGLRDYQIAPSVWGGSGQECEHEWGELTEVIGTDHRNANFRERDSYGHGGGIKETQVRPKSVSQGQFCRCKAWRGVLGLEPTPDCLGWARGVNCGACYICHMREVAAGLWRVLRDDGTLWVNIGDSYATSPAGQKTGSPDGPRRGRDNYFEANDKKKLNYGVSAKNRVGIPERLALALQADGWVWRDSKPLCKTSPMPESVTDRSTAAHEMLFMFAKKPRYFFDAQAVRESAIHEGRIVKATGDYSKNGQSPDDANDRRTAVGFTNHDTTVTGRNPRSWMLVSPEHTNGTGKHYATFIGGRTIPSFAIRAGSSEYGVCGTCGAPWERVTESEQERTQATNNAGKLESNTDNNWDRTEYPRTRKTTTTLGWQATCKHGPDDADIIPATILDPFSGSGTTQVVCRQLGRRSIYVDLSQSYADEAIKRLEGETPMLEGMATPVREKQLDLEAPQ